MANGGACKALIRGFDSHLALKHLNVIYDEAMPYKDKDLHRKAQREWAARNRETVSRNSNKSRRRKAQMVEEFKNRPCADCGNEYPSYVMDLDHLPGHEKLANISRLVGEGASWERLKAELEKCEVVCANCHRERTHSRHSVLA